MLRDLRARTHYRPRKRATSSVFGPFWPTSLAIVVLLMGILLFLSSAPP